MGVTGVGESPIALPSLANFARSPTDRHIPHMRGIRYDAASPRHCERSEAIHLAAQRKNGLLRCARNGGWIATDHEIVIPREGGVSSTPRPIHVIARSDSDEAIHVSACRAMDCFAALAMTLIQFRVLATHCARGLHGPCPSPDNEGAGNAGCLLHPRSRVQWCKELRTRAYRYSRSTPAFPAQWVDGLCRALPGDEFVLPPSLPA